MDRIGVRLLFAALVLLLVIPAAGAAHAHDAGTDEADCRLCRVFERPGTEAETATIVVPVFTPDCRTVEDPALDLDLDLTVPVGRRGPPTSRD